jgi:hypothetical protein
MNCKRRKTATSIFPSENGFVCETVYYNKCGSMQMTALDDDAQSRNQHLISNRIRTRLLQQSASHHLDTGVIVIFDSSDLKAAAAAAVATAPLAYLSVQLVLEPKHRQFFNEPDAQSRANSDDDLASTPCQITQHTPHSEALRHGFSAATGHSSACIGAGRRQTRNYDPYACGGVRGTPGDAWHRYTD